MVDPTIVSGGVEVGKLILQAYFAQMRQAGQTQEEADALYDSEKDRFKKNISEPLPDV